MSGPGVGRWLRVAFDDVILALSSIVRPWTDLRAVKMTQVDVVKAVAAQQNDVANALASVDALGHEVAHLRARCAEQEAAIGRLLSSLEKLQREASRESATESAASNRT